MAKVQPNLTKIDITRPDYLHWSDHTSSLSEGNVRDALRKIYSPQASYVLFQTAANPKAVEALQQYIGTQGSWTHGGKLGGSWEVRKIRKGDKTENRHEGEKHIRGLEFDQGLLSTYRQALDKIAEKTIGGSKFSHYSLVNGNGLRNDPKAIFWPEIYVVRAERYEDLKRTIDGLAEDGALEELRKIESPQFYQMGEIETLNKLGIAPIKCLEGEWRTDAKTLTVAVDFLTQMKAHFDTRTSGSGNDGNFGYG